MRASCGVHGGQLALRVALYMAWIAAQVADATFNAAGPFAAEPPPSDSWRTPRHYFIKKVRHDTVEHFKAWSAIDATHTAHISMILQCLCSSSKGPWLS